MVGFIWAYLGSMKHSIVRGGYNRKLASIPFVNVYYFIKVSDYPNVMFLLMFVPFFNLVVFSLVLLNNLSKTGQYSKIYRISLVLFYPVMSRGVL